MHLASTLPQTRLERAIQHGEFLITAEVTPPKGADVSSMLKHVVALKERVHAINVTDSNRAIARMSPLAAAVLIQQVGVEPVLQLACRDRNRIALQGDLMGATALGIGNVLALTGDPVEAGDCPGARKVFDLEAVRLLKLIRDLNSGIDICGQPLPDGPTRLFAGAAVDPQHPSLSSLERRCDRKVEMGAEFFQTQMITDFEQLALFMDKIATPLGKPILAGIFLLKSAKNALFINKNLPGVNIPDSIIERLANSPQPLQTGMAIAAEQILAAKQICQGVHIMAVRAEHLIPEILDQAGLGSVAHLS